MNPDDEREALDDLLRHPGWQRFVVMVEGQWGNDGARFLNGLTTAASDTADSEALTKLRQIIVAQREIRGLLRWPEERVRALAAAAPSKDAEWTTRRGTL